MKKNDYWRLALFAVAIFAVGINVWLLRPKSDSIYASTKTGIPRNIPSGGFHVNDAFKKAALNPEKTIDQMHNLFNHIETFKKNMVATQILCILWPKV